MGSVSERVQMVAEGKIQFHLMLHLFQSGFPRVSRAWLLNKQQWQGKLAIKSQFFPCHSCFLGVRPWVSVKPLEDVSVGSEVTDGSSRTCR